MLRQVALYVFSNANMNTNKSANVNTITNEIAKCKINREGLPVAKEILRREALHVFSQRLVCDCSAEVECPAFFEHLEQRERIPSGFL